MSARASRHCLLFLAVVLSTRLLAAAAIFYFSGGREFSDDVWRHMEMVRAPLGAVSGVGSLDVSMYPPLMGVLESVVAYPLQLLMPEFLAIRFTFILYETLAALLFWLLLADLVQDATARLLAAAAFVVIPMGWITSAIMAQDEVIGGCYVAGALLLYSRGKLREALILCGLGVVAGKVFLLAPLTALVLLPHGMSLVRRVVAGGAPIALTYGWVYTATFLNGGTLPLAGFAPPFSCVINVWGLIVPAGLMQQQTARVAASLLAIAAAMLPVVLLLRRRESPDARQMSALFAGMLVWIFVLFHHVNPEYYFLALPALLAVFHTRLSLALLAGTLTLPWAVNFLYGVGLAAQANQNAAGKSSFLRVYSSIFPAPDGSTHVPVLWLCVIATFGLALAATIQSLKPGVAPTVPKTGNT